MVIKEIAIYRINMPYDRPYPVSFNAIVGADAIVVHVRDSDGRSGWGEVTIVPGYTHETVESGVQFCRSIAEVLVGKGLSAAKRLLIGHVPTTPHAASPLLCAIEMLEDSPLLRREETVRIPVLAPIRKLKAGELLDEVEELVRLGHRTLKIKVGFGVEEDLERLRVIQEAVRGRAWLRVDANQGFSQADGCRFGGSLDPEFIELFEQPCDRLDWNANAAVADASAVPVMLDEQIYNFADIERAAGSPGVGYIKQVLEKFGSLELLKAALEHVRICGMQPVLGNGSATDITSWMEACVASGTVTLPCEMHSFLKVEEPLLTEPLPFVDGDIVLRPDYLPAVNIEALQRYTTWSEAYTAPKRVGVGRQPADVTAAATKNRKLDARAAESKA